jgi:hypothetical protein
MKYTIIERHSILAVEEAVEKYMARGYTPIGGVCVCYDEQNVMHCYQAVIRNDQVSPQ